MRPLRGFHKAIPFFFTIFPAMLSPAGHKALSDAELIESYKRSGDLAVLGELYQRYMPLVFGACLKYLKDRDESRDAVMQIFEKLVQSLRDHEVIHFKSWLYVLTRNHCLMQLRSKKGKNFEEISFGLMEKGLSEHPESEPPLEDDLSKLEKCIETLGSEQKHCVKLFFLQEKCYKEITVQTGYDLNQVKSYIQNGKRNLKLCMEHHG
jgi:RNA polymerase sigma-70 factor (ECF subfamily)